MSPSLAIGILADDLTGAADVGVAFAARGLRTRVLLGPSHREEHGNADVLVVDTESRRATSGRAYRKVIQAATWLKSLGCRRVYKKIDSGFRGNVGVEIEAAMEGLAADFTVVVPAFPKNGRVTRDGYHYVLGRLLARSDLARDPVHPMRDSFLPRILQAQTCQKVGLVTYRSLTSAAQTRAALADVKRECGMAILDVTGQRHLATIAAAVEGLPLVCGSGGLAEEIARRLRRRMPREARPRRRVPQAAVLLVSGSVTDATAAQVAEAGRVSMKLVPVDLRAALGGERERAHEIARVVVECLRPLRKGRHVVLHLPFPIHGRGQGRRGSGTAQKLTGLLADAAAKIISSPEVAGTKLVLAGGDTAASVCARLGVVGLDVLGQVQPGVAMARTVGHPRLDMVLKPGSFGDKKCLLDAVAALNEP